MANDGGTRLTAPVTGTVMKVLVAAGAQVREGDELVVLESMKMEIPLEAPHDGSVLEVAVTVGARVAEGDTVLVLA